MSHLKIPKALPFRFHKNKDNPDWFVNQIRTWERRGLRYHQKWVRTDTTKLQIETNIPPNDLRIITPTAQVVKEIEWIPVFVNTGYTIYELVFDISDLPEGIYFIYYTAELLAIKWEAISEPVSSRTVWPNTISFRYKHRFNDYDVAWSTGIEMLFRCEAGILDYTPERDRSAYINQLNRIETLNAIIGESYKIYIGDANGVPPYIVDILNYVWSCTSIFVTGGYFPETGYWQSLPDSKWEMSRIKGMPTVGAALAVAPAESLDSVEFNTPTTEIAPGIVTAYNIETGFFGPGTQVPVTEVEQNG